MSLAAAVTTGGAVTINPGATLRQATVAQSSFGSITVLSGGLITHAANGTTRAAVVNLSVTGDFNLQAGATIDVSGLGYFINGSQTGVGAGPGAGGYPQAGGAGHGGNGGDGTPGTGGVAYDSLTNPTDLGSSGGNAGGGPGGAGGGAVILNIGGNMILNGFIGANGNDGLPRFCSGNGCLTGAGAGGTVNITANVLLGSGVVQANGGSGVSSAPGYGPSGGGGGGRIALTVSSSDTSNLTVATNGGRGINNGGAGTTSIKTPGGTNYNLTIGNLSFTPTAATPVSGSPSFSTVTLNNSLVAFDPTGTVQIGTLLIAGSARVTGGNLVFPPGGVLEVKTGGVLQLGVNSLSGARLRVDSGGVFQQTDTQQLSFNAVTVLPGGLITHAANRTTRTAVVNFSVSGDFNLQAGATIGVSGLGYAAAAGPGAGGSVFGGFSAGGGGHGGNGGNAGSTPGGAAYESVTSPTDLGSGGASVSQAAGGAGGGAVVLNVGGTLSLNGLIATNGLNGTQGFCNGNGCNSAGGAGGTVNLAVGTLAGSGTVQANGGTSPTDFSPNGGGGGGRVAITVTSSDSSALTIMADGGRGSQNGGAGTISIKTPGGTNYNLTIGNLSFTPTAATPVSGSPSFSTVTLNNSLVAFDPTGTVQIGSLYIAGSARVTGGNLVFPPGGVLEVKTGGVLQLGVNSLSGARLLVDSGGVFQQTDTQNLSFTAARVLPGGLITHAANAASRAAVVNLSVSGDFDLQAGATIGVNALGYAAASGPGAGVSNPLGGTGSGGGHGGNGGTTSNFNPGGAAYDNLSNPTDLGSGGGNVSQAAGAAGGGAILLNVGGNLSLNGLISANGGDGLPGLCNGNGCFSGGGSGGAINLTAGSLSGSGTIQANGGAGVSASPFAQVWSHGGGGGGGRIFLSYGSSSLTGGVSAQGGSGVQFGGAGTVVSNGQLSIAGQTQGAVTPITPGAYAFSATQISNSVLSVSTQASLNAGSLALQGSAVLLNGSLSASTASIQTTSLFITGGTLGVPQLELGGGTVLHYSSGALTVNSAAVDSGATFVLDPGWTVPQLTVHGGGLLTLDPGDAVFDLNVTGNMTVEAGGKVSADAAGYASTQGPGAGMSRPPVGTGGGGGYGALGAGTIHGTTSGAVYGSITQPLELGSGGGTPDGSSGPAGSPGSGGGRLKIEAGALQIDGTISANGADGVQTGRFPRAGGGSGGAVLISAGSIQGAGAITANGGGSFVSGIGGGGGGGGGRIALYYNSKSGAWTAAAAGGTGLFSDTGNLFTASPGTVLDNGQLSGFNAAASSATAAVSQMTQSLDSVKTLNETVSAQTLDFSNSVATGTPPGTLTSAQMQLVLVKTGSFAGQGFFKGQWTLALSAQTSIAGQWEGMAFMDPAGSRTMILKGSLSGQLKGALDGTLVESMPGSGVFDTLNADCRLIEIDTILGTSDMFVSGRGSLTGNASYPGTPLTLIQTSLTGTTAGFYSNAVNYTLTFLEINSAGNPYNGEGLFSTAYTSSLGTGVGWAHAVANTQVAHLSGILNLPLRGLMEGALVLSSPRSLLLTLQNLDVGVAPQPDLFLDFTGPNFVNFGAPVPGTIELRNNGFAAATGLSIIAALPDFTQFNSASGSYIRYSVPNWLGGFNYPTPFVRWDLGPIPPRSFQRFYYQGTVRFSAPGAPALGAGLGGDVRLVPTSFASQMFAAYPPGGNP